MTNWILNLFLIGGFTILFVWATILENEVVKILGVCIIGLGIIGLYGNMLYVQPHELSKIEYKLSPKIMNTSISDTEKFTLIQKECYIQDSMSPNVCIREVTLYFDTFKNGVYP